MNRPIYAWIKKECNHPDNNGKFRNDFDEIFSIEIDSLKPVLEYFLGYHLEDEEAAVFYEALEDPDKIGGLILQLIASTVSKLNNE